MSPMRYKRPGEFKIVLWRDPPPVPSRDFDWHAEIEGGDETKTGHGPGPRRALEDLINQLEDFEE